MASIRKEAIIHVSAGQLWNSMSDVGSIHERLVPGFVTDCQLDGTSRVITFASGITATERIITIDGDAKRVVWSASGGRLMHHNASTQIFPEGEGRCRVVWIADLLPDELAPAIAGMIDQGLAAMKMHAEK